MKAQQIKQAKIAYKITRIFPRWDYAVLVNYKICLLRKMLRTVKRTNITAIK